MKRKRIKGEGISWEVDDMMMIGGGGGGHGKIREVKKLLVVMWERGEKLFWSR